jgi:hypothetical protein
MIRQACAQLVDGLKFCRFSVLSGGDSRLLVGKQPGAFLAGCFGLELESSSS